MDFFHGQKTVFTGTFPKFFTHTYNFSWVIDQNFLWVGNNTKYRATRSGTLSINTISLAIDLKDSSSKFS